MKVSYIFKLCYGFPPADSGEFKFRLVAAFLDAKIAFARVSSFTNEAVLSIKICKNSIGCLKF